MTELKSVDFAYGSVTFYKKIEAVPTTTKREGNVTINNMGTPEIPSFHEVSYVLTCNFGDGPREFSNTFHWEVRVEDKGRNAPYGEIEAEAARKIAPMLRAVADEIERAVAEFDSNANDDQ